MGLIDDKKNVFTTIGAYTSLAEENDLSDLTNIFTSINNKQDIVPFLLDVLKVVVGTTALEQLTGELFTNFADSVEPTLKEAIPGDLSFVLPYRHLQSILEMIEALDHIIPGVNSTNTLLYGVETKYYSSQIKLTDELETEIPNLYAIGDGAGITRSLAQASVSGIVAARSICRKIKE